MDRLMIDLGSLIHRALGSLRGTKKGHGEDGKAFEDLTNDFIGQDGQIDDRFREPHT